MPSSLPPSRALVRPALFLLAALAVALALHFASPEFVERDSFYHFGHARAYAERGLFLAESPWAAFSVVERYRANLWYGFHLFLVPFTWIPDPAVGLKWAGVVLLTLALCVLYAALVRLDVRYPEVWPFLLLFCAPPGLLRMLAVRPQVLSLALIALLFALLMRGRGWQVLACAAGLTFFHLNFAWMAPVTAVGVLGTRALTERKLYWRLLLATMAGVVLGWVLRPNPIGAAQLLYIQLPMLLQARGEGVPLLFGREMFPPSLPDLLVQFLPFLLLWLGCAAALVWATCRRLVIAPQDKAALLASLALSLAFFGMTVVHSARSADLWKVFAVVFIALAFDRLVLPAREAEVPRLRALVPSGVLAVLGAWMLSLALLPEGRQVVFTGFRADLLRPAAAWLAANTPRDSIVFHSRWELFGDLLLWNRHNRYINGMDPIFLYARSPALYWEMHHLALGATRFTFTGPEPSELNMDDTYRVLRRDFDASYLLLEKSQRDLLYFVRNDPKYTLRFEDEQAVVFEIRR